MSLHPTPFEDLEKGYSCLLIFCQEIMKLIQKTYKSISWIGNTRSKPNELTV